MQHMIPLVWFFGELCVYLKVTKTLSTSTKSRKVQGFRALLKSGWHGSLSSLKDLLKLKSENEKMRASLAPQDYYLEAYILPAEWVKSPPESFKGLIKEGELTVCESACVHRHDHPLSSEHGRCYVNAFMQIIPAVKSAHKAHVKGETFDLKKSYMLRLTAWGDVSRLNDEGHDFIESLIFWSDAHLAYTAGWRKVEMQRFKGLFMASCSTVTDALLAKASNWEPFMSAKESEVNKALDYGMLRCPTDTALPRPKTLGCSLCPLPCDSSLGKGRVIVTH